MKQLIQIKILKQFESYYSKFPLHKYMKVVFNTNYSHAESVRLRVYIIVKFIKTNIAAKKNLRLDRIKQVLNKIKSDRLILDNWKV